MGAAGPVAGAADAAAGVVRGEVLLPIIEAVDTLGAGDAFHGALAWAYATAADVTAPDGPPGLGDALAFAGWVATIRCETAGPRAWLDDGRVAVLAHTWLANGH
jgi:sugar/nucleoside kinase (ribokinase family)